MMARRRTLFLFTQTKPSIIPKVENIESEKS